MQLIRYFLENRQTPSDVIDGGQCCHLVDGKKCCLGISDNHEPVDLDYLLEAYFKGSCFDAEIPLRQRITDITEWLDKHGIDYSGSIDLLGPSPYGIEGYLRNFGPDRFGVHRAGSSPMPVRS